MRYAIVETVTLAAILACDPQHRPASLARSPAPRVNAATKAARKAFTKSTPSSWALREASDRLRRGNRYASFPAGSFPLALPSRRHSVTGTVFFDSLTAPIEGQVSEPCRAPGKRCVRSHPRGRGRGSSPSRRTHGTTSTAARRRRKSCSVASPTRPSRCSSESPASARLRDRTSARALLSVRCANRGLAENRRNNSSIRNRGHRRDGSNVALEEVAESLQLFDRLGAKATVMSIQSE